MVSTAGQPNDDNEPVRESEKQTKKRSNRPFCFSWGPKSIWSICLIARERQLATKQRLTQVAQMSTRFEAPPRYIKVLSFGWFWEQHRSNTGESLFQRTGRDEMLPGVAVCPKVLWEHLELPCKHVAQQDLLKIPTPVSRSLPLMCLSGVWKFFQLWFLLLFCPKEHKGSNLPSFSWTLGKLKKEIHRSLFALEKM